MTVSIVHDCNTKSSLCIISVVETGAASRAETDSLDCDVRCMQPVAHGLLDIHVPCLEQTFARCIKAEGAAVMHKLLTVATARQANRTQLLQSTCGCAYF